MRLILNLDHAIIISLTEICNLMSVSQRCLQVAT